MHVKCKFQLTSETESSETIHPNNERVRLCTSVDLDKNSTLIVMICSNDSGNNHIVSYYVERKEQKTPLPSVSRTKSKVIVKQIYYHNHNEDIVAICLTGAGDKLALLSASSTVYILPIKNILLNLHAQQLNSSQGKSMYFYDASILDCCAFDDPIAVAYWECVDSGSKAMVIIASASGKLSFIGVEEKKEVYGTQISEQIKYIEIIKDEFTYSLLITCENFKQYRFVLELVEGQQEKSQSSQINSLQTNPEHYEEYSHNLVKDIVPTWDKKPILVKLEESNPSSSHSGSVGLINRFLGPSKRKISQTSLFPSALSRGLERAPQMIFYHPPNFISVVDVIDNQKFQLSASNNRSSLSSEPRLIRFFPNKQFHYRSAQKPNIVCKLTSLLPDEIITHLVLTERLLAITTSMDRCLINSRNCCNLKNLNSPADELDPIIKEITFSNQEKILTLLKSPVSNDKDGIIDSFLLVTSRSIYTIEARRSCRNMYISLIDTHLAIKPVRSKKSTTQNLLPFTPVTNEFCFLDDFGRRKSSDTNLIVSNFLSHRDEVYERINHDTKAFSQLFKLELNSLYEAYADKLLIRNRFDLANKFFQMANFDDAKIVGKYVRLCAYKQTINYEKFLEFITSYEVTKVLLKDINITSEFLGYKPTLIKFRKYSFAALRMFELYKLLIDSHRLHNSHQLEHQQQEPKQESDETDKKPIAFDYREKRFIENIFTEFLTACLEESIEDSSRLWFNYINFYLNYVGTLEELESDILNLLDSNPVDCRLAIALYAAIGKDENGPTSTYISEELTDTTLSSMKKLYNLSELFKNEFLMKLLDKTLDLIPLSADPNALQECCWRILWE